MSSSRASGRVYRDYYSARDTYAASNSPSTTSTTDSNGTASSPRTVVPILRAADKGNPNLDYSDSRGGFAQTSSRDGDASSFESETFEPTLDGEQLYTAFRDSATALPALPNDVKGPRDSSALVRNKSTTLVPPPRDPSRAVRSPAPDGRPRIPMDGAADKDTDPIANMPEFFSQSVFHTALYNPTISHQLLKFCQSRLCGENMEFLARVHRYRQNLQQVAAAISSIHSEYLSAGATSQINVPESVLVRVNNEVKSSLATAMPKLESIFNSAQTDIEQLVYGFYPNFVRHQMGLSAAKALGGDRAKYAGLGDCFVLTDPSKADNPIVFASPGFVKVTGYSWGEIIPRNCRFLQSSTTDRAVVKRIKDAIEKREESVELLLNQRKDGEPFWNLLYTTPLFDAGGKLAYFLGGQINCSTTVHSTSDVLRILAQSTDKPSAAVPQPQPKTSTRRKLLRSHSRSNVQQGAPGMEDGLLDRLESMPLQGQFRTFYNAYSNFIIVNYSTFLIAFVSTGIVDMLFPIKAKANVHAAAAGNDIFKFLSNHGTGSLGWDFKSAVRGALKSGGAISLDLKLCSRPLMGIEKFISHWTPLKNEKGVVSWVVVTLGNDQRG